MLEKKGALEHFQVQPDSIVFMCPLGRGGSILMHVLLANHPEIHTSECFIWLNEEIIGQDEINSGFIKQLCSNQLSKFNNLWLLDTKEIDEKEYDFDSHKNCKCNNSVNGKRTLLLHVHNILYDINQFQLFNQFLTKNEKNSLLICHREWLENISARQRYHPIVNIPRWISILYWITIEEIAKENLKRISNRILVHKVNLRNLHMEANTVWRDILDFLGVNQMPVPLKPKVRDLFWFGGNRSGKVVNPEYAKYLAQIDLSSREIMLIKFLSIPRYSILKFPFKKLVYSFALFVTVVYLFKDFLRNRRIVLDVKNCQVCEYGGNYFKWSFIDCNKLYRNFYAHLKHLDNGGPSDYLRARKSIKKWKKCLTNLK